MPQEKNPRLRKRIPAPSRKTPARSGKCVKERFRNRKPWWADSCARQRRSSEDSHCGCWWLREGRPRPGPDVAAMRPQSFRQLLDSILRPVVRRILRASTSCPPENFFRQKDAPRSGAGKGIFGTTSPGPTRFLRLTKEKASKSRSHSGLPPIRFGMRITKEIGESISPSEFVQ